MVRNLVLLGVLGVGAWVTRHRSPVHRSSGAPSPASGRRRRLALATTLAILFLTF